MAVSYIPARDADFQTWVDNFSTLISADPTGYGLSSADASALASMTAAFDAALSAATSGDTRGPSTVNAKDIARANVQARARQLATIIQANPSITDTQKTDLQITVRKTNLTPIPAPTTSPLLAFVAATPLQHTIRFSDQATPAARVKPFGVTQLTLRVWITPIATEPAGPPTYTIALTKNPAAIDFDGSAVGKLATYKAVWQTLKGLQGPISNTMAAVVI